MSKEYGYFSICSKIFSFIQGIITSLAISDALPAFKYTYYIFELVLFSFNKSTMDYEELNEMECSMMNLTISISLSTLSKIFCSCSKKFR